MQFKMQNRVFSIEVDRLLFRYDSSLINIKPTALQTVKKTNHLQPTTTTTVAIIRMIPIIHAKRTDTQLATA